jgi:hypothetical protein
MNRERSKISQKEDADFLESQRVNKRWYCHGLRRLVYILRQCRNIDLAPQRPTDILVIVFIYTCRGLRPSLPLSTRTNQRSVGKSVRLFISTYLLHVSTSVLGQFMQNQYIFSANCADGIPPYYTKVKETKRT